MGIILMKKHRAVPYTSFNELPLYEQRYLPRWEVQNQAYYHRPGTHQIFKTETRDISLSGACLYVSPHIHPNERIELKIYLSPEKNFEATGTVIWKCTVNDDCCYAGVFFDRLPEEIQSLILEFSFIPPKPGDENKLSTPGSKIPQREH